MVVSPKALNRFAASDSPHKAPGHSGFTMDTARVDCKTYKTNHNPGVFEAWQKKQYPNSDDRPAKKRLRTMETNRRRLRRRISDNSNVSSASERTQATVQSQARTARYNKRCLPLVSNNGDKEKEKDEDPTTNKNSNTDGQQEKGLNANINKDSNSDGQREEGQSKQGDSANDKQGKENEIEETQNKEDPSTNKNSNSDGQQEEEQGNDANANKDSNSNDQQEEGRSKQEDEANDKQRKEKEVEETQNKDGEDADGNPLPDDDEEEKQEDEKGEQKNNETTNPHPTTPLEYPKPGFDAFNSSLGQAASAGTNSIPASPTFTTFAMQPTAANPEIRLRQQQQFNWYRPTIEDFHVHQQSLPLANLQLAQLMYNGYHLHYNPALVDIVYCQSHLMAQQRFMAQYKSHQIAPWIFWNAPRPVSVAHNWPNKNFPNKNSNKNSK